MKLVKKSALPVASSSSTGWLWQICRKFWGCSVKLYCSLTCHSFISLNLNVQIILMSLSSTQEPYVSMHGYFSGQIWFWVPYQELVNTLHVLDQRWRQHMFTPPLYFFYVHKFFFDMIGNEDCSFQDSSHNYAVSRLLSADKVEPVASQCYASRIHLLWMNHEDDFFLNWSWCTVSLQLLSCITFCRMQNMKEASEVLFQIEKTTVTVKNLTTWYGLTCFRCSM